jgi:hypothetical protein
MLGGKPPSRRRSDKSGTWLLVGFVKDWRRLVTEPAASPEQVAEAIVRAHGSTHCQGHQPDPNDLDAPSPLCDPCLQAAAAIAQAITEARTQEPEQILLEKIRTALVREAEAAEMGRKCRLLGSDRIALGQWEAAARTMEKAIRIVDTIWTNSGGPHD